MWQWLADLFTGRTRAERAGSEADVEPDPAQVETRPTGPSTRDTFVGRVAGEDGGDAGSTGAEARGDATDDHDA
jgi:hypothetical protein